MPKTVSVSEAKTQFSAMIRWAIENDDYVIVEKRGVPTGVIISYAKYQETHPGQDPKRRQEALQKLEELAKRMWARNADLTPEETEELAEEISQETIQRMVREGKVRFQSVE